MNGEKNFIGMKCFLEFWEIIILSRYIIVPRLAFTVN